MPVLNEKAWIFKIAENTAKDFLTNTKSDDDEIDDEFPDPNPTPEETFEKNEEGICIRKCYQKVLEREYPHAICPLIVALCELESPIDKIADVISLSIPETEKLLKKCYDEMRTLKRSRGEKCSKHTRDKGILERCREEKAGYKDYYNDYQTKHSHQEGAGSLCWLVAELIAKDMTMEEIGKLINKKPRAIEKTWERCLDLIDEEVEKCLRQNCGW